MYTNTRQQHKNMATFGTLDAKTLLNVIEEEHRQEIQRMQQQLSAECAKLITENSNLKLRNQTLSDKIGSYSKVNKELSLRLKTSKREKEKLRQEVESLKAQRERAMDMDIDDGNREIQESDYYFPYNFASSPSSYTYSSS